MECLRLQVKFELNPVQALKMVLQTDQTKAAIAHMGGYDTQGTGSVTWIP
jgi:hypothetical protein